MKKIISLAVIIFICMKGITQELLIESDEPIIRSDLKDILVIKQGGSDKTVWIRLSILKADKDVSVTVSDFEKEIAISGTDYVFDKSLPRTYRFTKAENMTNIIKITIKGDANVENVEYAELDFKWPSLSEEGKTLHRVLRIKIIDKAVKTRNIKVAERPDTEKMHKDITNGNKYEYSQFTNFLGFDNDKPNGRFQTEFRLKWGIAKRWHGRESQLQWQFLRSVIFPDILINRIDKSQKEESYNYAAYLKDSPNPDSSSPKFTTMDIWKYSNLHIGGRVILAAFKKDNFRFHLQAGVRLVKNKPFVDTSISQSGKTDSSIFRATYSVAYNVEIFGKTLLDEKDNINLDFNAGIMWLYLHDSYYKQYDAAVIDQYNRASILLPVNYPGRKVKPVYMVSFRLTKNFGADDDHYIYFRGSWMGQTGTYNPVIKRTTNTGQVIYQVSKDPTRFYNNFLQIQAGISLDIKELFKKKTEEKKVKTSNIGDTVG